MCIHESKIDQIMASLNDSSGVDGRRLMKGIDCLFPNKDALGGLAAVK